MSTITYVQYNFVVRCHQLEVWLSSTNVMVLICLLKHKLFSKVTPKICRCSYSMIIIPFRISAEFSFLSCIREMVRFWLLSAANSIFHLFPQLVIKSFACWNFLMASLRPSFWYDMLRVISSALAIAEGDNWIFKRPLYEIGIKDTDRVCDQAF